MDTDYPPIRHFSLKKQKIRRFAKPPVPLSPSGTNETGSERDRTSPSSDAFALGVTTSVVTAATAAALLTAIRVIWMVVGELKRIGWVRGVWDDFDFARNRRSVALCGCAPLEICALATKRMGLGAGTRLLTTLVPRTLSLAPSARGVQTVAMVVRDARATVADPKVGACTRRFEVLHSPAGNILSRGPFSFTWWKSVRRGTCTPGLVSFRQKAGSAKDTRRLTRRTLSAETRDYFFSRVSIRPPEPHRTTPTPLMAGPRDLPTDGDDDDDLDEPVGAVASIKRAVQRGTRA